MKENPGKNGTVCFPVPPTIEETACIGGRKEKEGPLGGCFDQTSEDEYFGTSSWEQAESELLFRACDTLLQKSGRHQEDINYIIAGDLQAQSASVSYGLRSLPIPLLGVFGACSTMAESLSLSALTVGGGFASRVIAATSSHFCSAEKQFRYPLEYGGQRTPTAQWTVTASGAALVSDTGVPPYITHVTCGKMVDFGLKDAANMGAAMAPAFADTLIRHFEDTGRTPADYDLIVSGDLGRIGSEIAKDLLSREGYPLGDNYKDCGVMIFDPKRQDVHAGGSGCGCSASVLCGHIIPEMKRGKLKRVLFAATGALLNPIVILQKESIPSICHAVAIDMEKKM